MLPNRDIIAVAFYFHLFIYMQTAGYLDGFQDQTSSKPNTLIDDADDIQKQLDNEARDRLKYGRPKTIWVFNYPTTLLDVDTKTNITYPHKNVFRKRAQQTSETFQTILADSDEWNYKTQNNWYKRYPECGSRSQSPVDVPTKGLIKARGGRHLIFKNYDTTSNTLTLMNNGKQVIVFGEWDKKEKPLLYGGAAHSRRYVFHSLSLHWPSEHTIGGFQYPLETQVIHISAEYNNIHEAIAASTRDRQAFLAVANLYKFSNYTQDGLNDLLKAVILNMGFGNTSLPLNVLSYFSPRFKRYACYYGSLTTPPCTQSVLWIIRAKTLPVTREAVEAVHNILSPERNPRNFFYRQVQPLNDRKIYCFN